MYNGDKHSAEVDSALDGITTASNVGQANWVISCMHEKCVKDLYTMQGFILTATEKCTFNSCRLNINFDKVNGALNESQGHRVIVHV